MNELNGLDRDILWIRESLERIEVRLDSMDRDCRGRHHTIDQDIAALSVRAGLYGAIAGAAPAVGAIAAFLLGGQS